VTGEKMADGSPMLAPGTYVLVRRAAADTGSPRCYIGRIVGTDMGRSKYEIGMRFAGWSEWRFLDGGSWAGIGTVTEITEAEALAVPGQENLDA